MSNRKPKLQDSTIETKPEFEAVLTPHRSLSKTGFIILMIFVSVSCFASGVFFFDSGRMAGDDYYGAGCVGDLGGFQTQLSHRSPIRRNQNLATSSVGS